jgi:hypothetical protein
MVLETTSRVSEKAKAPALAPDQPLVKATDPTSPASATEPGAAAAEELLTPERAALLRKVVPAVWLLSAVAAGVLSGPPLLLLVLAAGALTLVVTLLWFSVQSLTGGASLGFEEALGMGAPSKVEEQKRAVLRALKDLEYERGVGKISPEDYAELSAKYRAEAKRLMQTLDEALGPARAEVEKAIAERLGRAGILLSEAAPESEPPKPPEAVAAPESQKPSEMPENSAEPKQPEPPEESS